MLVQECTIGIYRERLETFLEDLYFYNAIKVVKLQLKVEF